MLSSLIPVPGGIGAAEASLSAGLIAMGVDEPTAFAIALTQRLCTFYLPPIWGFVSLRWLSAMALSDAIASRPRLHVASGRFSSLGR